MVATEKFKKSLFIPIYKQTEQPDSKIKTHGQYSQLKKGTQYPQFDRVSADMNANNIFIPVCA